MFTRTTDYNFYFSSSLYSGRISSESRKSSGGAKVPLNMRRITLQKESFLISKVVFLRRRNKAVPRRFINIFAK